MAAWDPYSARGVAPHTTQEKVGVVLKLDFEKAYDKVKWLFLLQTLRMKGFSQKWCRWVESFVSEGSVAIKVDDEVGNYFQTRKGLRQGDPASPILFTESGIIKSPFRLVR